MRIYKAYYFFLIWINMGWHSIIGQSLSVQLWTGMSNYQGDIRTNLFSSLKSPIAKSIGFSYSIGRSISLSAQFSNGFLQGNDKSSSDPIRRIRNLNFKTSLNEWSLLLKKNIFEIDSKRFNPFIEMGLAIFHFNPYTFDAGGNKQYLKNLGTEGQGLNAYPDRKPYALTQIAIPLGAGLDFRLNHFMHMFWNFSWRKTFTDYIDDISSTYADPDILKSRGLLSYELAFRSNELNPALAYPFTSMPRGNSKNMDGYFFTGLGVKIKMENSGNVGSEKVARNQLHCPKF